MTLVTGKIPIHEAPARRYARPASVGCDASQMDAVRTLVGSRSSGRIYVPREEFLVAHLRMHFDFLRVGFLFGHMGDGEIRTPSPST